MKIEVGKLYRTRDGRKVRIYAVDGTDPFSVHGAIKHDQDDRRGFEIWTQSGVHMPAKDSSTDIVSEWHEPRVGPRRKAWVLPSGNTISMFRDGKAPPPGLGIRAPWLDEPDDSSPNEYPFFCRVQK